MEFKICKENTCIICIIEQSTFPVEKGHLLRHLSLIWVLGRRQEGWNHISLPNWPWGLDMHLTASIHCSHCHHHFKGLKGRYNLPEYIKFVLCIPLGGM